MVITGDCIEAMGEMAPDSVDSIVTDPPYGLGFLGKEWDELPPGEEWSRECLRVLKPGGYLLAFGGSRTYHRLACAVEDAGFEVRDQLQWVYATGFPKSRNLKGDREGWGTALKPAHEPIVLARRPLAGTVAENVLAHGTGALNIDGCRISTTDTIKSTLNNDIRGNAYATDTSERERTSVYTQSSLGRWPANVVLDEEAGRLLDEQAGTSASRFFYCAKASKGERNAGLDAFEVKRPDHRTSTAMGTFEQKGVQPQRNHHPTVKPISLMRYLVRLVTPPEGTVLDPFLGSGTTGIAAGLEGFDFIGIERDPDYVAIAEARIKHWANQPQQLGLEAA